MPKKVVKVWKNPSSRGTTTYETLLWSDGSLSCDCPGWTFLRAGQSRTCKHVRAAEDGRPVKILTIPSRPAIRRDRMSVVGRVGRSVSSALAARTSSPFPSPVGRLISLGGEEV